MLIASLAVLAGLVGGAVSSKLFTAQSVQAQKVAEKSKAPERKWEHCAITPGHGVYTNIGKATGYAAITYLRGTQLEYERVEATIDYEERFPEKATDRAVSRAVERLGDEGWEMIGEGMLFFRDNQKALYFKRPKP